MTSLIATASARVVLETAVNTLESVSRIWPARYKPEALKNTHDDAPEEVKPDTHHTRGDDFDSIYAPAGPGQSGFKLSFLERMNELRKNGVGFDVEIMVGPQDASFQAHKITLANSGPFFYSAIYGGLRVVKRVKIPDCDPDIFQIILDYIYTQEYGPDLSFKTALAAIDSAKCFGIQEFVDNIYEFFTENLSFKNVLDLLDSPYLLDMPPPKTGDLEMLCMDIVENETERVLSYNMETLKFSRLCRILKSNNIKISEIDLFQLVYKWSNLECQRRGLELWPENIRKVGNDAFKLLRIPIISLSDIENVIAPTKVLTNAELAELIEWKNSSGGPFTSVAGFSRYFRIGGIPGMTDFPPLQREFGCNCDNADFLEHINKMPIVISDDPETAITQRKLAELLEGVKAIQAPASSFAGKFIKFKTLVDNMLKEIKSTEQMNNNLIVDNDLD